MSNSEEEAGSDPIARFLKGEEQDLRAARATVESVLRFGGYAIPATEREDIVQEVLLDACRALGSPGFRIRRSLDSFLRTLAHRRCIDWRRRRRREQPLNELLPDGGPDPQVTALANERRRLATWIIGSLSVSCRELIRMHVQQNLRYEEIAGRTGRSEGALRVEMCKCLKEARALVEKNLRRGRAGGGSGGEETS
jgi:RNA polymerase sigma factor (sigma-70 family)